MKDVAAKAGVHHSTVSLCLKNSSRISRATKDRILTLAREMGYRPHPYLSTLMHTRRRGRVSGSSEVLALVIFTSPDANWKRWLGEFKDEMEPARTQARARGFKLEFFEVSPEKFGPRRMGDILYSRNIKGVLLGPWHHSQETFDWQWERFTVVALGPSLHEPRIHRVRHHHFQAMLTAVNECHRLGYRRVGLTLKAEINRKLDQRWLASYLMKRYEAPCADPPEPHISESWTRESFLDWFEAQRPDAIITINVSDAKAWLTSAGCRIPRDVGLVGLSVPRSSTQTGIYQDWPTQGRRATTLLIDLLRENAAGLDNHPNTLLVNGVWIPGSTVRKQL